MARYDAVVIGAGNGGLTAAATLAFIRRRMTRVGSAGNDALPAPADAEAAAADGSAARVPPRAAACSAK